MLGAMRSYGSDSSDEPIRYTRRTPLPPRSSRNIALDTGSSDDSADRQTASARLRAAQSPALAARQLSGDLHAAVLGASGRCTIGSNQESPDVKQRAVPPPAQQAAAHSAHVQQVACGTVTAALSPATVRSLSSTSVDTDSDAPLTFSRSVPRPRGPGSRAAAAQFNSSSDDSPCGTFRRSVPRRAQPNMLYDSEGVDTPPANPARRHVLLALPAPEDRIRCSDVPGRPKTLGDASLQAHFSRQQNCNLAQAVFHCPCATRRSN